MRGSSCYPLVDRDGESCLDTVLRILQPPSIAENSFDPAPMDTSWNNYEEDAPTFGPSFEDHTTDSVTTFDIRTLVYQGCKGLVGAQHCTAQGQLSAYQTQSDYHTAAFHRWMHPPSHQRNPMLERMTVDQEFYSPDMPMQKVKDGPEDPCVLQVLSRQKILGQACQSFPDSCILHDEEPVDSTSNVMPCHYRISSTYDSKLDNCSGGLDPAGYYVQQTLSSSHELAGRLELHPSDACELTALVRQHTTICVRQKPTSHSSNSEHLAAHDIHWSVAERQDSSENRTKFPLYCNKEAHLLDVRHEASTEVVPQIKEPEDDLRELGAMSQGQKALLGYPSSFELVSNASQLPCGSSCATVNDIVVPQLQDGTPAPDFRCAGQEARHLETQQSSNLMIGDLSDYDKCLTQAWRRMMHASSTIYGVNDNGRTSEMLHRGLLRRNRQEEYDGSLEGMVDTALTKRPITCNQVADMLAAPVYSTRVSSEIKHTSEVSRSFESEPSNSSSPPTTLRLLDGSSVSQGRSWVGIIHQELSSGLARLHHYCGLPEQPRSPRVQMSTSAAHDDEIAVHQATSRGCPSRFTTAQNFQPSTPEAKELKAAAASLMELCADSLQPVPLALKLPPKLSEVDMARLLQAYRHLNAYQVKEHFPFVKEADVYSLHPSDLIAGAGAGQYFFSETKYGSIKKPTRLRITKNGYRWKQQGRTFAIQEGGRTVAFKTYLSYVPLKHTRKAQGHHPHNASNSGGQSAVNCNANQHTLHNDAASTTSSTMADSAKQLISADPRIQSRNEHYKQGSGSHRKWALWTMEEIALAEDVDMERTIFKRGGLPRPFPVLCKIGCRTPVEDVGQKSRNILPCAVPIAPSALTPMIQERNRRPRGRHQLKRKTHFTGVILAASSGTDGSSVTGTCGAFHLPPSKPNPQLLLTC